MAEPADDGPDGSAAATIDTTLLAGSLKLRQLVAGHRAGTDAVLLAAAAGAVTGHVVDVGAGAGAAGLAVALRSPDCRVSLLEREPELCRVAADNIALNGLAGRAEAVAADALAPAARAAAGLAGHCADVLLTNPPYQVSATSRVSPDPLKARAHTFATKDAEGLEAWLRACAALLRPGGDFVLIHRADALGDVLAACARRFGALRIRPVFPKDGAPASRILVRGVAGSRAPLAILPGLTLHRPDGGFTAEAAAIHAGAAGLAME